jgi:hypothetical protein
MQHNQKLATQKKATTFVLAKQQIIHQRKKATDEGWNATRLLHPCQFINTIHTYTHMLPSTQIRTDPKKERKRERCRHKALPYHKALLHCTALHLSLSLSI